MLAPGWPFPNDATDVFPPTVPMVDPEETLITSSILDNDNDSDENDLRDFWHSMPRQRVASSRWKRS